MQQLTNLLSLTICTDSLTAIQSVFSSTPKKQHPVEAIKKQILFNYLIHLTLVRIPSHANIHGND